MNAIVLKRPDQPELDEPYFAALDGDEYWVLDEARAQEKYPPVFAMCRREVNAIQIQKAINNGVIVLIS